MLEKLKGGVRAIFPVGLTIAVGLALWLGSQQFMLRQQAANLQNKIDGIQKDLEQTPKSLGQAPPVTSPIGSSNPIQSPQKTPPPTSPVVPSNPIQSPQKNLGQTLEIKDRLTLQKDLVTLEKERIATENAIGSSLIQGLGGLFIFVTAYIAWLNLLVAQRNLLVAQDKQTAERFSKAVEQLDSRNIHTQLGGIYALEQIAKDAEEKYYWPVMQTLTAYVRIKAKRQADSVEETKIGEFQDAMQSITSETIPPHNSLGIPEAFTPRTVSDRTDIQSILDILGRRGRLHEKVESYLDLSRTDLRSLSFRGNFTGIRFRHANLQGVRTSNANFQNSELDRAKLLGAYLYGASFRGAKLMGADLRKATLDTADFSRVDLFRAYLSGAKVEGTNFQGAKLLEADLQAVQKLTWKQLESAEYDRDDLPDYLLYELPFTSTDESPTQKTKPHQPPIE